MADGTIRVAPDSTGKFVDTTELTVGVNTVERERVVISGGAASELADVRASAPGIADKGLVVRHVGELRNIPSFIVGTSSNWSSANSVGDMLTKATDGYGHAVFYMTTDSGTFTAGQMTFQNSWDGSEWFTTRARREESPYVMDTVYTFVPNDKQVWVIPISGWSDVAATITQAIVGTGHVFIHLLVTANAPIVNEVVVGQPTPSLLQSAVSGDVASNSADSGNPVKIGVKALNAVPAVASASGNRINAIGDMYGRQIVAAMDPGMQVWQSANFTTQQTGGAIWTPAAGKKIAVTYLAVSSYATTGARVILWFGASGDTTYTPGTDQPLWVGSFAPSTTSKPGVVIMGTPVISFANSADFVLKATTDAAISLDVTVNGYEF